MGVAIDPKRHRPLPAVGKLVGVKMSKPMRQQLDFLRVHFAELAGDDEPLSITQVIRTCIHLAACGGYDYQTKIIRKRLQEARDQCPSKSKSKETVGT